MHPFYKLWGSTSHGLLGPRNDTIMQKTKKLWYPIEVGEIWGQVSVADMDFTSLLPKAKFRNCKTTHAYENVAILVIFFERIPSSQQTLAIKKSAVQS